MNLFDQILNQAKLGTPGQFSGGSSFGSINTQDFQSKLPTIQKSLQAEQNLINQGFSEKEVKFLKLQKEKGVDMNQAFAFVEQKRQEEAKAKNPDLGIMGGLKEGVIGATQFGQQAPSAVGNLLNFTQKYVTTPLIAGGLEMVGAEGAAQKWRSAGEKFGTMAKQSGEQFSSEAMQAFGPLTENQLQARQTGANLALTAPIPLGKVPSIIRGAGLAPTIGRGAYYGAVGTPTYTAVSEGRLPTGGEMATGIVGGAVAGPLLEKVAIPAVSGIANKTQKYGTALVKGGAEGLKKSVSRDLAGIPKAIQSKAEAISTRANRFNALDEEKFTKQIGETPGQFAVSRGMTDVGDDAIVKANQNYQKSLEEADKSIGAIEGNFSTKGQKDDILGELVGANKAKMELQPRNPDANKARQLFNKYESGEGLTMAEINEAKRIYQRNHTYTYEQLASNEARNSKYLQDSIREWQFKTARENGLSNIASINKTTKAWKMWADSLAKKLNRSQANNEFGITDWIALSGGTPENIALFLGKKVLSSKYVKSGIIKALGKQTKPSIITANKAAIQQANFQKNVNRGISNNRGDVGGKSMVKPAGLLPGATKEAIQAQEEALAKQQSKKASTAQAKKLIREQQAREEITKTPDITERSQVKRPKTLSTEEFKAKKAQEKKSNEARIRNTFINNIKNDIASATKAARYGGTGNIRLEPIIDAKLSKGEITKGEALAILEDVKTNRRYEYIDQKALDSYIEKIKIGKVESFEEMIAPKPQAIITPKTTHKQIYDKLQIMANDGRYGEKSWNDLAKEFKKQTGKDIMDVSFEDFGPDGMITRKIQKPSPQVKPVEKTVNPTKKSETNITRNEAIEKGFSNSAKARWNKGDFTMKERGEATKYLKSNYKGKEYMIDGKKYKVDAIDNRNEKVRLVDSEGNIIRVKINKLPETKVTDKDIFDYYNGRVQKGYKTILSPTEKVLTPKKESATIGDMETKKLIPKEVYHGTDYDSVKIIPNNNPYKNQWGDVIYMTGDKKIASSYGKNVYKSSTEGKKFFDLNKKLTNRDIEEIGNNLPENQRKDFIREFTSSLSSTPREGKYIYQYFQYKTKLGRNYINEVLKKMGYDGVYGYGNDEALGKIYGIFNTKNISK